MRILFYAVKPSNMTPVEGVEKFRAFLAEHPEIRAIDIEHGSDLYIRMKRMALSLGSFGNTRTSGWIKVFVTDFWDPHRPPACMGAWCDPGDEKLKGEILKLATQARLDLP